jgi:Flp pilus assembly protein TadG
MERLRNQNGAVAVEFALILPILIVLLLGIIEFSLVYNAQLTLTNAAREGARDMAITNSASSARTAVKNSGVALDPALTDADIGVTPATCAPGSFATVTVTYEYEFISGMFGLTKDLVGKAAMRCGG